MTFVAHGRVSAFSLFGIASAALAVTLALAGCATSPEPDARKSPAASATPTETRTPRPTSTEPEPEPEPAAQPSASAPAPTAAPAPTPPASSLSAVQVTGAALVLVGADGSVVRSLAYADTPADDAAAAITGALGAAPTVETSAGDDTCLSATRTQRWPGGLAIVNRTDADNVYPIARFVVALEGTGDGAVRFESGGGFQVGAAVGEDVVTAAPFSNRYENEDGVVEGWFASSVANPGDPEGDQYGAMVHVRGGIAYRITAPSYFVGDC